MDSREQRLLLCSAAICSVVVLAAAVLGLEQYLAFAAPVLMLALPLVAGRYLGEERLTRLACRRRRVRVVRPASAHVPKGVRVARRTPLRGGRLIATSLANRPPPALAFR